MCRIIYCLFVSYHYLKHFVQYSDIPYNDILQIVYQHTTCIFPFHLNQAPFNHIMKAGDSPLFRVAPRLSHPPYVQSLHGEKNLGLNTRELMSFTRGLLVVRMPQASLAMFAMTSCVQCTIRSLVLKAPTHLRKSLQSVGFIATPRCAKPVKFSTGYFQEIPRNFSVRLLAIAL